MKRIFIRMGGHINVRSEEELRSILRGDVEALRKCICRDGFDTDGDAYIPVDGNEGLGVEDEVDFVM